MRLQTDSFNNADVSVGMHDSMEKQRENLQPGSFKSSTIAMGGTDLVSNSFKSNLSDAATGMQVLEDGLVNEIVENQQTPRSGHDHSPIVQDLIQDAITAEGTGILV